MSRIHPTAVIDAGAVIGADVEIGPYAIIGPGAHVGDRCRIHAHAVIEHTTLGEECEVYPFAAIGLPAQHLGYKGEPASVVVGKKTVFREGVTVHRGTAFDKSITTIGDSCFFMATSHVAHDCRVGNRVILANAAMLAGHVEVGDNAFISASVGIHQYVRLGACVMISGGSMVGKDVAPFCIAQGDRASLRGINVVGMRRMGFDRVAIRAVKEAYKAMFLGGLRLEEGLRTPEANVDNPAVKIFREFITISKRGVLRADALAGVDGGEEE